MNILTAPKFSSGQKLHKVRLSKVMTLKWFLSQVKNWLMSYTIHSCSKRFYMDWYVIEIEEELPQCEAKLGWSPPGGLLRYMS